MGHGPLLKTDILTAAVVVIFCGLLFTVLLLWCLMMWHSKPSHLHTHLRLRSYITGWELNQSHCSLVSQMLFNATPEVAIQELYCSGVYSICMDVHIQTQGSTAWGWTLLNIDGPVDSSSWNQHWRSSPRTIYQALFNLNISSFLLRLLLYLYVPITSWHIFVL